MALTKRSLLWAAADTGGTTAFTFVTMILMARMMTPEQFGTGALVIGTVQFLNLFVGGFFHDALIQNPNTDDEVFETAISLVLVIAFGVCVSGGVGAAIAAQYKLWTVDTSWLFVVASIVLPFSGVVGIGFARMRRDLIFRDVAQASLVGRLFGCLSGLLLAILGFGAWSLVAQFASDIIVQTVWLFGRSGWWPRPRRSFGILWPICRFALPYAVMHSLVAVRIQGFLMMVAGFLSLSAAGYVNVAFRLTNTPQILLATAFTNLGLPLLARDQNSGPELERSFLLVTDIVLSVTIPAFVGLALAAKDLVPVLLGAEWITVIPLVQILAVGTAVTFLRFPASSVLRALGYVRYSFASSAFQLVFTLLAIFVLRPNDLRTIVWLWILPTIVQWPATLLAVARVSKIRWRVLAGCFVPILSATSIMSIVVIAVADAMRDQSMVARLLGEVGFWGDHHGHLAPSEQCAFEVCCSQHPAKGRRLLDGPASIGGGNVFIHPGLPTQNLVRDLIRHVGQLERVGFARDQRPKHSPFRHADDVDDNGTQTVEPAPALARCSVRKLGGVNCFSPWHRLCKTAAQPSDNRSKNSASLHQFAKSEEPLEHTNPEFLVEDTHWLRNHVQHA